MIFIFIFSRITFMIHLPILIDVEMKDAGTITEIENGEAMKAPIQSKMPPIWGS